jgi:transcriptional regulator with XRE-family HTH domain
MKEKNIINKSEQGKRLKESRLYLNLKQEDFGKKVGLKWSQVKDREAGTVKISPSEAKIISHEYGISYDWLLTGQGSMPNEAGAPIAENAASYAPAQNVNSPSTGNNQDNYLTMTAAIIGTPSIFATALKSNIEAFHSGIRLQQELAAARAMLTIHDEQIKSQRDRMNTLEDLIRQKEDKKAG